MKCVKLGIAVLFSTVMFFNNSFAQNSKNEKMKKKDSLNYSKKQQNMDSSAMKENKGMDQDQASHKSRQNSKYGTQKNKNSSNSQKSKTKTKSENSDMNNEDQSKNRKKESDY